MLFKAHRIRKGVDIYGPAEYILRTLYRDEGSHRIYHLEAGDQSKHTIWDDLNSDRTRFFYGETSKENREKWNKLLESGEADTIENDNHSSRLFYNQADVLEDAVLFPEEQSSESINPLQIGSIEPIKKWEDEGLSLQAWVNGADLLNSDTEDESEEDSGGDDDEVLEDDDGSSEWEDDDDDEAYSDDGEADPLMAKMLQKFMEEAKSKPDLPEATEESFMTFLDREKARSESLSNSIVNHTNSTSQSSKRFGTRLIWSQMLKSITLKCSIWSKAAESLSNGTTTLNSAIA